MSAGQDYNRTIKPSGSERINSNGETFIFCKFADRDITVDIAGRKVVMRAGSYQEFEPLVGDNAGVTLYNDDPENPAYVTLVMGTGTYDEKIIRGEVTVNPGVRKADGRFVDDLRRAVHLALFPKPLFSPVSISQGNKIDTLDNIGGTQADYAPPTSYDWVGSSVEQKGVAVRHNGEIIVTFATFDKPGTAFLKLSGPDAEAGTGTVIPISFYEGGTHPSVLGYLNDGRILFSIGGLQGVTSDQDQIDLWQTTDTANLDIPNRVMSPNENRDEFKPGIFEYQEKIYVPFRNDLSSERGFYVLDQSLSLVDKFTVSDTSRRIYTSDGKTIYSLRDVSGQPVSTHDPDTLEPETSFNSQWSGNSAGITINDGRLYVWEAGTSGPWGAESFSLVDYEKTGAFYVGYAAGGCPNISRNPQAVDTGATFTISENAQGEIRYSGEIVRLVLDALQAEKQVTDDYRDHVYAMSVNGEPLTGFTSNSGTMAAAKIDDDFTVTMPLSISITIDNGLTYKGY